MNSTDPLKATLVSLIFNRDCTTGTTDGETTLIEYDVDADEVVRDIDGTVEKLLTAKPVC